MNENNRLWKDKEVIVGKPIPLEEPNYYPVTRISSSELGATIHNVCERVNRTGISERINGLQIVPNKPKDKSAAWFGWATVFVFIAVIVIRIISMGE